MIPILNRALKDGSRPLKRQDVLLAVFVALIWGLNFVVMKVGLESFPPLMLSALRSVLGVFPLIFFCKRPNVGSAIIIGIGFAMGVMQFALLFIGMDIGVSAGLASLILQSQAFFTVILAALLFSEHPSRRQVLGICVAFTGIALVATTVDQDVTIAGLTLVVLAGLAWATSNLIIRQAGRANMLDLMVWASLVPPVPLFALSLALEGPAEALLAVENLNWKGVGSLLFVAYVATILAFAIWGRLIQSYGAGNIAPFSLLVPVFGMLSSAILLGETFGVVRIVSAVLVVTGLGLIVWRRPKAASLRDAGSRASP